MLTRDSQYFDANEASHLLGHLKHSDVTTLPRPPLVVGGVPYWSGKSLVSVVLPDELGVERPCSDAGTNLLEMDVQTAVVKRGRLLTGRLTKALLGTSSGGIVDILCRIQCRKRTADVMSDLQRLAYAYHTGKGFSVGIEDCLLVPAGEQRVQECIRHATQCTDEISEETKHDDLGAEDLVKAERTIRGVLGTAITKAGSIVEKHLPDSNKIKAMIMCGSKGSTINLSQVIENPFHPPRAAHVPLSNPLQRTDRPPLSLGLSSSQFARGPFVRA